MSFDKSFFQDAQNALTGVKAYADSFTKKVAQSFSAEGEISVSKMDASQLVAYDVAFIWSEVSAAEELLRYASERGGKEPGLNLEELLACIFTAETLQDVRTKILMRPEEFCADEKGLQALFSGERVSSFLKNALSTECYARTADEIHERGNAGDYGLSEDHNQMRQSFEKFAKSAVEPLAEKVHRHDLLIPEDIISGLSGMGCFGLTIPEKYGGLQEEMPDNVGMAVVTEELSRGSLGVAGSLITRPEILGKALLKGGTEEQKMKWLPLLASGEKMVAVAVTEPDFGSDVAGMKLQAVKTDGGWLLNGVKTWCTFAGRADIMLVLARTDPDMSKKHKGLSIFIVEKPRSLEHSFAFTLESGGKLEGRAIGTIGYRGMHSYEVVFENVFVPDENLIGGDAGLGKGFYLQMEGFAGGRLQTAARALGVMQAAFDRALQYARERKVFGRPIFEYGLTKYKIARMAALIQASRQFTYACARLMDKGKGQMEASMCKFFASKMSEWVAREAMQIHGGMGYAEEYAVSRYFVDARVFSIFEGAEEILALRVIAKMILEKALKQ